MKGEKKEAFSIDFYFSALFLFHSLSLVSQKKYYHHRCTHFHSQSSRNFGGACCFWNILLLLLQYGTWEKSVVCTSKQATVHVVYGEKNYFIYSNCAFFTMLACFRGYRRSNGLNIFYYFPVNAIPYFLGVACTCALYWMYDG